MTLTKSSSAYSNWHGLRSGARHGTGGQAGHGEAEVSGQVQYMGAWASGIWVETDWAQDGATQYPTGMWVEMGARGGMPAGFALALAVATPRACTRHLRWWCQSGTSPSPPGQRCLPQLCFTVLVRIHVAQAIEVAALRLTPDHPLPILAHPHFVTQHTLPTIPLIHPIPIILGDGSTSGCGGITHHTIPLSLIIGPISATLPLAVANIGHESLIIGLDWLQCWNPEINWQTGAMTPCHRPPCNHPCQLLSLTQHPSPHTPHCHGVTLGIGWVLGVEGTLVWLTTIRVVQGPWWCRGHERLGCRIDPE